MHGEYFEMEVALEQLHSIPFQKVPTISQHASPDDGNIIFSYGTTASLGHDLWCFRMMVKQRIPVTKNNVNDPNPRVILNSSSFRTVNTIGGSHARIWQHKRYIPINSASWPPGIIETNNVVCWGCSQPRATPQRIPKIKDFPLCSGPVKTALQKMRRWKY